MKLKFLKLTQQSTNKYFLAESRVLLTNFTVPDWHIWQLSRIFCNDLLLLWIRLTLFLRTRGIFRSVDGDCALGTDEWTNFLNYGIGTIALFPRIPAAPGKLWNLIPKRPWRRDARCHLRRMGPVIRDLSVFADWYIGMFVAAIHWYFYTEWSNKETDYS